jgi:hypothetical protein
MTFQFLCPQGHLLAGEEAHMGMQCECPQCGTAFIIPTVDASGQPVAHVESEPDPPAEIEVEIPEPIDALSQLEDAAKTTSPVVIEESGDVLSETIADGQTIEEVLLHIPCPNGHELETPPEMIGKRAKCPHCGAEFRLKRELSVEYFRQQEILERRQEKFWFQLAIVAAGFVVVVVLAMIIIVAVT